MTHNVVVKNSSMQGKGVFAARDFKAGDFVLVINDSHVVTDESKLTKEQHEFDLDYLNDRIILMQEPEKYINHSCNPTVYVKTKNGVRNVYAFTFFHFSSLRILLYSIFLMASSAGIQAMHRFFIGMFGSGEENLGVLISVS